MVIKGFLPNRFTQSFGYRSLKLLYNPRNRNVFFRKGDLRSPAIRFMKCKQHMNIVWHHHITVQHYRSIMSIQPQQFFFDNLTCRRQNRRVTRFP